MKKVFSLIMVLALVLCLATVAFAAPVGQVLEQDPETMMYPLDMEKGTALLELAPEGFATVSVAGGTGATVETYAYYGDDQLPASYSLQTSRTAPLVFSDMGGNATATLESEMFSIQNDTADQTIYVMIIVTASASAPVEGTWDNPVFLPDLGTYTATNVPAGTNPYTGMVVYEPCFYKFTATETGLLIFTIDKDNETGWTYCVDNLTSGIYGSSQYSTWDDNTYIYCVPVTMGDEIQMNVGTAYCGEGETVEFNLSMVAEPAGTFNTAAELIDAEVTVPAGSYAIYTINSMLNGMELTVEGGAYTLNNVMGGTELDGTPVNILVLINDGETDAAYTLNAGYPIGSEGNPIPVNVPADLTTATVPMFGEVWYAVSSRLDGTVLTVEGEGAYVIVNGTRVDAVDGIVTVNLVAEGATIPVVIGNDSWDDAEYACTIEYLPTAINAAGSYEAQVGAGTEVAYLVNSRLDGYVLTVEGEDAYVVVNGTKYEAVDGVVTVTLKAEGATIPVFVGNAGDAAAVYTMVIAAEDTIPPTGDMIAVALVMMLTSGTALVSLKKKEN